MSGAQSGEQEEVGVKELGVGKERPQLLWL